MAEALGNGFIKYLDAIHIPHFKNPFSGEGKMAAKIRDRVPGVIGVAGIPVVLGYVLVGGVLMLGLYGLNRSRGRLLKLGNRYDLGESEPESREDSNFKTEASAGLRLSKTQKEINYGDTMSDGSDANSRIGNEGGTTLNYPYSGRVKKARRKS